MSDGGGKAWFVAALMGVVTLCVAAPTSAADDLVLNVPVASQSVQPGDVIAVTLDVAALFEPINGVQSLLQYDSSILTLQSIVPTDLFLAPPDAGWVEVFFTDVAGDITYAISVNGGEAIADQTVATLNFLVIDEGTTSVTFRPDASPVVTKLTASADSATIFPNKIDSQSIVSSCDDGLECTSDTVVGGFCQNTPLTAGSGCGDPTADDCGDPDTCDGAGTCLPNHFTSTTTCLDEGNDCTDDVCDGSGVCTHPNLGSGTVCADDLNDCTLDVCDGVGTCTHPNLAGGAACGDQSTTDCSDPDACDGSGTCLPNDLAFGTACPDDLNDCTTDECDGAGVCAHPSVPTGTACNDQSITDCSDPDTCDASGNCLPNDLISDTLCPDDLNDCTDDVCDGAGVCSHPDLAANTLCADDLNDCTDDVCDGAGLCTHPSLPSGTTCGDPSTGDCTSPDSCDSAGNCLTNDAAFAVACTDDLMECTDDICDGAGACTHPNRTTGTACGDASTTDCTDPDSCDGSGACLANDLALDTICTDEGNVCTSDLCDGSGTCAHLPLAAGTSCGDSVFCNGLELCDDLGSCQPATDPCAPLLCDEGSTSCLSLLHVSDLEVFYAGKFSDQGDPSKSFLAVGSAATLANVTHYAAGITGIRVTFDAIVTFATTPEAAFTFEWTTEAETTFSAVTDVATNVTVTPTVVGADTVVDIVLADGHVVGRWLKVTIDATQITASGVELDGELTGNPTTLPSGDGSVGGAAVFFVGNIVGDADGDRKTRLTDVGLIRVEVQPFVTVPIDSVNDVDKDGRVRLGDVGLARASVNPFFTLPLITP